VLCTRSSSRCFTCPQRLVDNLGFARLSGNDSQLLAQSRGNTATLGRLWGRLWRNRRGKARAFEPALYGTHRAKTGDTISVEGSPLHQGGMGCSPSINVLLPYPNSMRALACARGRDALSAAGVGPRRELFGRPNRELAAN